MTKRQTRTRRGLRYQALAEGYKLLKPEVAKSYQLAADHYDRSDPPLDLVADADKRESRIARSSRQALYSHPHRRLRLLQ
jgi:hypothetical protein